MSETRNEETIRKNISKTITQLKKDGIVAMGMANLFQVTPTTGVDCPAPLYRPMFERIAKQVAKKRKFPILKETK